MKLSRAPQEEIDRLMRWLQAREKSDDPPPAFMRVVFGYETLVQNCCDPAQDVLDWKPGHAPSDFAKLRAAVDAAHELGLAAKRILADGGGTYTARGNLGNALMRYNAAQQAAVNRSVT